MGARGTGPGTRARAAASVAAVAAVVVVVTVLFAARAGDGSVPRSPAAADPTLPTVAPDPEPTSPPTTPAPRPPLTIAFGGDVHFESYLRTALDEDADGMLAPVAPLLAEADVAVVNLETAITERGTAVPGKEFAFRAPPRALRALAAAGVDVVSLANNHGLDFGPVGIEDARRAGEDHDVAVIGIGRDAAEAYRPFVADVRGRRVAIVAATQVLDSSLEVAWTATDDRGGLASAKDESRLLAAVEAARAEADAVVVFLHWGTELDTCPQDRQRGLARRLADAGVEVVVGGHAHRLQGAGFLGGTFVAYGLGNFVWYARPGPSAETGVLLVTIGDDGVEGYEWSPARIERGIPRPLEGDEARAARQRWDELRACTDLTGTRGDG